MIAGYSMRRALTVLTVVCSLCVALPSRAEDLLLDRFSDYLESLRAQASIPGVAALMVGNNGVLWEHAFGRQDVDRAIVTRTDTPFHGDGLTQMFTAALVLRCVEEGRLSLDDRIGVYKPFGSDPDVTLRQLLTHTSGPPENLVFAYRPDRLEPLKNAIRACTDDSYRETLANRLVSPLIMYDSVPGPDMIHPETLSEGIPDAAAVRRYKGVLDRLAIPYIVDSQRRMSPSRYSATTITPASGLISTVRDLARFHLALKAGSLLRADTLALAWQAPLDRDGRRLPHGLGWFVQSYNGETIVWQYGVSDSGSSSLWVTVPGRGLTLILLANSSGLARPFNLAAGDLTVSPFARLFLGLFVR
jgi:CubicO group peptidase (beta-lactamase class C family)